MLNRLKRNMSLITMVSLLGLFLTACTQSGNGTEYGQDPGSSDTQASATPTAASNSNMSMSNMNMPAKPTLTARKNMQVAAAANQVVIENFSFAPATLTVKTGTKVTWINRDDVPHTVNE